MTVTPDEVRAIVDKVKAELPGHQWVSGTVTRAVSDAGFSSIVELELDGDLTGTVIQATNLTNAPMVGGTRVKVVFDPPQGVYVLGVLVTDVVPLGRLECSTFAEGPSDVDWHCTRILGGNMTTDGTSLFVPLSGLYSVTARVHAGTGGGTFSIDTRDSDGNFIQQWDYAAFDNATSTAPVLLAAAVVPVLALGSITIVAGGGLDGTDKDTGFPGHFDAHYVAPYIDPGAACTCSSG